MRIGLVRCATKMLQAQTLAAIGTELWGRAHRIGILKWPTLASVPFYFEVPAINSTSKTVPADTPAGSDPPKKRSNQPCQAISD